MSEIFNKIISFSGAIDRKTYWLIMVPMWLVNVYSFVNAKFVSGYGGSLPGTIQGFIHGESGSEVMVIIYWISFIGMISLLVRRLRDVNISVWWVLPAIMHTKLLGVTCIILGLLPSRKK
ncbi:DUF805 domain-containing protein [Megasphaera sp.]|uniref:DUF805 domain-containing protein n=1 Tax=Megasphaera TaxID=906 RepID=UPI001DE36271|nr:DUF805 domain-containing protein [Megasphaera sp.]